MATFHTLAFSWLTDFDHVLMRPPLPVLEEEVLEALGEQRPLTPTARAGVLLLLAPMSRYISVRWLRAVTGYPMREIQDVQERLIAQGCWEMKVDRRFRYGAWVDVEADPLERGVAFALDCMIATGEVVRVPMGGAV